MQREQQNKLMDEMFSPISGLTLPASIEERLEMYRYRMELEDKEISYKIIKQKFLNYRQFSFKLIKGKREVIPAYTLSYSTLPREKAQGRIEYTLENIHYFNREEIKFITLQHFNFLSNSNFANITELIFNPLSFEEEFKLRDIISPQNYDLTPIIIVDKILDTKLTIELNAKTYEDVKEKLIIL